MILKLLVITNYAEVSPLFCIQVTLAFIVNKTFKNVNRGGGAEVIKMTQMKRT